MSTEIVAPAAEAVGALTDVRRWRRYPAYKNSGSEWFREIPSAWDVRRLKSIVSSEVAKSNGEPRPFVGLEHVESSQGALIAHYSAEMVKSDQYLEFEPADILFGKLRPYLRKYWLSNFAGCCSTDFLVLRPSPCMNTRYLSYLVGSSAFIAATVATSCGVKMPRTSWDSLAAEKLGVPTIEEQRAIVALLDYETAKIDALVQKKRRQIELLEEKRAALISHAVTRGLDPSAPMEDSGVPWLGEVPAHWRALRVRDLAESLQTGPFGSQLHQEDYTECGVPVINPSHLVNGTILPDSKSAVDEATADRLKRHQLAAGDIVFARRGEMGRCALATEREAGWICGTGSLRVRPRPDVGHSRFLNRALSISKVHDWLTLESVGATMENLNSSIVGRIPLALPPWPEQRAIVEYLDREAARIDRLIGKVRQHIDVLGEYRTALISAAVTGKIDVRDEVGGRT